MKPFIYKMMLGFALAPATLFAQDSSRTTNNIKTPKLVLGLHGGVLHSYDRNDGGFFKTSPTTGLFMRYYIGEHFAIESGFNYSGNRSEIHRFYGDTTKVTSRSYSIPIHFQYHFLKKESRVRPYLGIGIALGSDFYHRRYANEKGATETTTRVNDGYFQFTQGITWQISKNLQLNQSSFYRWGGLRGVGVQVGLGYTIR